MADQSESNENESDVVKVERLRQEARIQRWHALVKITAVVSTCLFPTVGAVGVAWALAWAFVEVVPPFAGASTVVSLFGTIELTIQQTVSLVLGVGGVVGIIASFRLVARQRDRWGKDVERLAGGRRKKQEQRDPGRESSGVDAHGNAVKDET